MPNNIDRIKMLPVGLLYMNHIRSYSILFTYNITYYKIIPNKY